MLPQHDKLPEFFCTLFSLPFQKFYADDEQKVNNYDAVLNEIRENPNIDCSIRYPRCSMGIWNSNFMI